MNENIIAWLIMIEFTPYYELDKEFYDRQYNFWLVAKGYKGRPDE
jgi:hypothetical protein